MKLINETLHLRGVDFENDVLDGELLLLPICQKFLEFSVIDAKMDLKMTQIVVGVIALMALEGSL